MRDDLLDAQACVDWAVSNFPSLKERMETWLNLNVEVVVKDPDPNVPNNVIVAVEKQPLPLAFNVEVGAYINTLRSSLDILATALAYRHGIPNHDDHYFPIVGSADIFALGKYKGAKLIKGLPGPERSIIESLKPYKGGNDALWSLHQLDIMRKHRRLLAVDHLPGEFRISGWGLKLRENFWPVSTGWVRANNETILGLIAKDAPKTEMKFAGFIAIDESSTGTHKPVIRALDEFASLADSIINFFDG